MHARARFQPHDALAFILKLDPAFQNVDQLKRGVVQVRLTRKFRARSGPNHMRVNAPARGRFDAQIAVFVERSQPAFEGGVFGVGGDEIGTVMAFLFLVNLDFDPMTCSPSSGAVFLFQTGYSR